jgi:hypothetical protein
MSVFSEIVGIIRNRAVPKYDPTLMQWPRGAGLDGSVRVERTLWVLANATAHGVGVLPGDEYIARVIDVARETLLGSDAALPSPEEPDGPGDWRGGLRAAVRAVKRPAGFIAVRTTGEPEWRRWIIDAILGELEATDAIVIRGT